MEEPRLVTRKRKAVDNNESSSPKQKLKKTTPKGVKTRKVIIKKEKAKTVKKEKKDLKDEDDDNIGDNLWDEAQKLSFVEKVPPQLAEKFISLLTEGCTLPFIARYRKEAIGHLLPNR